MKQATVVSAPKASMATAAYAYLTVSFTCSNVFYISETISDRVISVHVVLVSISYVSIILKC